VSHEPSDGVNIAGSGADNRLVAVVIERFATERTLSRIGGDLWAVIFTVGIATILFLGFMSAANGGWKLLAALPGAAVLGFTLWTGWYALTRRCYWVSVNADGSCEFRALARRTRLTAAEILRIERSSAGNFWHSGEGPPSHPDNTKVVHRDGSVIIVQPLAGFERLQALIEPVADQAE
jgi:hypothetical protein